MLPHCSRSIHVRNLSQAMRRRLNLEQLEHMLPELWETRVYHGMEVTNVPSFTCLKSFFKFGSYNFFKLKMPLLPLSRLGEIHTSQDN